MPAIVCKKPNSEVRRSTQFESEVRETWLLKGFENSFSAETALYGSPLFPQSLISAQGSVMPLVDVSLQERGDSFLHQGPLSVGEGPMIYEASVAYSTRGRDITKTRWSIAHPTQQKHIDYALERIAKSPGAPDHNGAVNVKRTSDGFEVQGVDLPPPGDFTINMERSYPPGFITEQTLAGVLMLRYTVNISPFGIFAPGECCFVGADFRNDVSERVEVVNWQFEISANTSPFQIFGHSIPIKYGWDYFWVSLAESTKDNQSVVTVDGWYLDRIMPFVDWTQLSLVMG